MNACSSAELFWRTNERISLGRRLPALRAQPDEALDVGDDLVVLEADARRFEHLLAGRVDADVDRVEAGLDHARGRPSSVISEPLLIMPDFLDALLLGVAHLLDQLPVDERLAVVVHADVRDAERRALVDDLAGTGRPSMIPCLRCMSSRGQNTHLALQMFVLSIWTISGQAGRAVASGRQQQPAHGLRVCAQQALRGLARTRLEAQGR